MQSLNNDERKQVLGEVLADELKVIREYVEDIPDIKKDVHKLKEDIAQIKSDMKIVKVITKNHESRIMQLEPA